MKEFFEKLVIKYIFLSRTPEKLRGNSDVLQPSGNYDFFILGLKDLMISNPRRGRPHMLTSQYAKSSIASHRLALYDIPMNLSSAGEQRMNSFATNKITFNFFHTVTSRRQGQNA